MKQLTHRDFPQLLGFDRLFNELDRMTTTTTSTSGYPPYNVISENDNEYIVEIAVAGFGEDALSIEEDDGTLTIRGLPAEGEENRKYVHKGISTRKFERSFTLADHVHVEGASVENGLLSVKLVREVPEALQPRKIAIEYKK